MFLLSEHVVAVQDELLRPDSLHLSRAETSETWCP